jgi:hypothetical protein
VRLVQQLDPSVAPVESRWPRHKPGELGRVLLVLAGLFILGNALCARYPILLVGWVVAAVCHGAFFGAVVANVLGVPAAAPKRAANSEEYVWRAVHRRYDERHLFARAMDCDRLTFANSVRS